MTFGNRIKTLRIENKMTQDDLAKILKVARATVGRYENDERFPDKEILECLADYFNVSVDYLLARTDNKKSETKQSLPIEFNTPEEAMKFILEQNVIMGFGGFDVEKMSDEEIVEFANELLRQLKLLSYKYKK